MTRHTSMPVALAFAAALTVPYLLPVAAQTTQAGDSQAGDPQPGDSQTGDPGQVVEEVVVVGERRASSTRPTAKVSASNQVPTFGATNLPPTSPSLQKSG